MTTETIGRVYTITGAAQRVPCPSEWLRKRDDDLQPLRDDTGRRLYDEARIQKARALRARSEQRPV